MWQLRENEAVKGDIDHVQRPLLPWRVESVTECGLEDASRTITRQEFYDRMVDLGQQRTAMTVCMTCFHTCQRHAGRPKSGASRADLVSAFVNVWEHDPAGVIEREVQGWKSDRRDRMNSELRAIGFLVAAHRDEFDAALEGMESAPSLADLRSKKLAKERFRTGKRRL